VLRGVVVAGLGGYRSEKRATPWVSPWWWLASVGPDLRKEPWVSPEKVAGLTHRWWWWKEKKKKKKCLAVALCWWLTEAQPVSCFSRKRRETERRDCASAENEESTGRRERKKSIRNEVQEKTKKFILGGPRILFLIGFNCIENVQ
jgi:hypothetical protein